jgi:hypothetical protein
MATDDTWYPPTADNPLPVSVLATPPPPVDTWFPPSGVAPLPVYIVGEAGLIADPPDNQLYGRRGPPGSGEWDLISLAAGAPEAPTTGPIFGRGQVAGVQAWTPVLPLAGGTMTGVLTLAADPVAPLQPATKEYVDNVGAVANAAVRRAGDAMTGFLSLAGNPTAALHAATKQYVDNVGTTASGAVQRAGDTMTGLLVLSANPANPLGAATKQYVDAVATVASAAVPLAGGTMTGPLVLNANPTAALGAATKQYVDAVSTVANAAVRRAGDTMTGALILNADPTTALGAATKQYADAINAIAEDSVALSGDTMTGLLILSGNPTANLGAATKQYVDALGTSVAGAYLPLAGGAIHGTPGNLTVGAPVGVTPAIGGAAFAAGLTVNANVAGIANPVAGSLLTLQQVDGSGCGLQMNAFGAPNLIYINHAQGTAAAPSATGPQTMLNMQARGYDGAVWSGVQARIAFNPITNPWTTADHSTQIVFGTTLVGSTTLTTQATIGPGLTVGAPQPPSGGTLAGDVVAQRLIVNENAAAALPAPPTASGRVNAEIIAFADGAPGRVLIDSWTQYGGGISLRQARGTAAAPAATVAGDNIGQIEFWGHAGAAGYAANPTAYIYCSATDTFSATTQGSELIFSTTAAGTTTSTFRLTIAQGLQLGAPTGGDKGAGTLNATAVYANGVALTSDARLKRDLAPLPEDCLGLVAAIEPKRFRFIEPPPRPAPDEESGPTPAGPPGWFDRVRWGFVAQDVEAAMQGRDFGGLETGADGMRSLSYNDLLAVLWQAVRELEARHGA